MKGYKKYMTSFQINKRVKVYIQINNEIKPTLSSHFINITYIPTCVYLHTIEDR